MTIYFVGAGPGDPRLITVRGAELLRRATHVFHDEDVHPDTIALAVHAKKYAVRRGERAASAMLEASGTIVRLTSGDPLVFHDDEEIASIAAQRAIEIVPGVMPLTAMSAYTGILLTRERDITQSIALVNIATVGDFHQWDKLSQATDVIAIRCAPTAIDEVARTLVYHGRSPTTPVAMIADLSLPTQRVKVGTLSNLPERAGLMIVGATVRATLAWFEQLPLFGKRILILRARAQGERTAALVRERGGIPLSVPAIELGPPDDPSALAEAVRKLGDGSAHWDWLAFTSENGVHAVWQEITRQRLDARAFSRRRIAAIGPATAGALAERSITADVVAEEHVGEGLAKALLEAMKGRPAESILIARAQVARDALPEALRAAGCAVDLVAAYRTRPVEGAGRDALLAAAHSADVVLLTSSSTADSFCEAVSAENRATLRFASIGPITSETARARGLKIHVEAPRYTVESLLDAL